MVIAKFNIISGFAAFNMEYFNDELPMPNFAIKHSYRTLGLFHCDFDWDGDIVEPTIEMSDYYDYTEAQFRDILVHEMIHYYLLLSGKDKKCRHGKAFKKMAKEFNLKYGMNNTPRIDLNNYKIKEGNSKFMFRHCTLF